MYRFLKKIIPNIISPDTFKTPEEIADVKEE
jgi:hypothetical protein